MQIKTISYLQSVVHWKDAPVAKYPEYAFVGRSNVGKSSLINMLANHDKMAKTSSKPGKHKPLIILLLIMNGILLTCQGMDMPKFQKQ